MLGLSRLTATCPPSKPPTPYQYCSWSLAPKFAERLGSDMASIPEHAKELRSIADQIELNSKALSDDASAAKSLSDLLRRGVTMLGAAMGEPHNETLRENVDAFAKGSALANVLRNEAKLLAPYLSTVRVLGAAFQKNFK